MADKEINLRRLVIKAFHMTDVEWGEENTITTDGHMTVSKGMLDQLVAEDDCIEKIDIQIIKPGDHDRWTNTIMDIIPISTKVLGKLGEGITHTITGVYVMLTGVDVNGKQCHEFGSSEGNLKEQLYLNRAGTPGDDDYIISFDVKYNISSLLFCTLNLFVKVIFILSLLNSLLFASKQDVSEKIINEAPIVAKYFFIFCPPLLSNDKFSNI